MREKRLAMVLGVFGVCVLGLMAWVFGVATGPASGQTASRAAALPSVNVTMGKPSEFAFTLSKSSLLPVGKIKFVVTNKGVIAHSFKVCTKAVTTATANSCVGTATKVLNKGQSQTITLTFKKGKYEFLCTVSGHASNGMKGLMGIGVSVSKAEASGQLSAKGSGSAGGGGLGAATTCTSPRASSVTVTMADFTFSGVPATLPCGTITFTGTNTGIEEHNISIQAVPGAAGPILAPGSSGPALTVTLAPGRYTYQCDVGDHAAQGMVGSLVIT